MDKKLNIISGAKSGSSSQSITNTPDTLRSVDTVEVILGLCEGPIYGLVNGDKSFYVGDTQLQNNDGSYNFNKFKLDVHLGLDNPDDLIPVLGGSTINHTVSLQLAKDVAVTRQTTSGAINYIDVRIAVSQLVKSTTEGTFTTSFTIRIEYKPLSGSTWTVAYGKDIKVKGKTTSTYIKEFRIGVDPISEPYDIRITKLSKNSTTEYFATIAWESFQEIIAEPINHPNTALVHLVGQASDQFSSIPVWSGEYKGLLIKVPSNYNPVTRVYTGTWDGTFQIAWTDNPAWITYDIVMNDRYGIKSYYKDVILDKYDVYEAGQWCDELVPDGLGGTQPRYTFNALLTEARSGKELARYVAGTFNATYFDTLSGITMLKVDKDDTAVQIFTPENVINGEFEYSYSDLATRYNDITVTFRNSEINYDEDRRRVYNQDLIDRNGRIPLDFIAVGCTDAHEAVRRAQYKLISANTEVCTVSFNVNRIGQFLAPFDVILIADPDLGYGLTGRIKSISMDRMSVDLRNPIYLEAGITYVFKTELTNGEYVTINLAAASTGYKTTLRLASALPTNVVPDRAVFTLESDGVAGTPRPFRVLKVVEQDGQPDAYTIEAVNINRNKWYDSDNVEYNGDINYSRLPNPLDPPGPISCSFVEEYKKSLKEFHITVTPVFNTDSYKYYSTDSYFEVWSRPIGDDEAFTKKEVYFGDTLINHPPGEYEFKILAKSSLGVITNINNTTTYTFTVTNPSDPPADVTWAKINNREVYWGYDTPPDDFAGYRVRYHNIADRTTWDDAIQPHVGLLSTTSFYTNLIPHSARVIMIKAVDDFNSESVNPAIVYRALGDISYTNIYEEFEFSPAFSGTKTGCAVESGALKATDTGGGVYSGNPNALVYSGGNMYGSTYYDMFYEDSFTSTKDGKLVLNIDFEGVGYEAYIREHGTTTWQPIPADYNLIAGWYDVKIRIPGGDTRGVINTLSIIVDVADVIEDVQDITVDSGGIVRIPLTKNFTVIKLVNVIIQDDGVHSPVASRILDKDVALGPQIKLLDKDNIVSAGLIDAQVKGY